MFDEVVGRVSGVKGSSGPVTEWVVAEVCMEWKEVSSRLMWVRVRV